MNAIRARFAIALLALGLPAAAHAQGPASPDTLALSLEDAVHRALSHAQAMRVAEAQITAADGRVREALSAALPQVNASLTYGRQFASIFQGAAPDSSPLAGIFRNSPFGSEHSWTADLTGSQLLWSGGRVGAGLAAARAYRRAFRAQRAEVASDLAWQATRAYLEAVVARQVLDIRRAGRDRARDHLAQVTLGNREGSRSDYDLIRARVDAANEEPAVVAAANAAELAALELKRLLDLPLELPLRLVTPLAFEGDLVPVPLEEPSADPAARAALAQAEAEVEARRQAVRLERAARWPQLSMTGTVSQQAFPRTERPELDEFRRSINASVKLELPIFLGLRDHGATQRARGELRQAEAQRDEVAGRVRLEIARARRELRRTLAEMAARRGTARLAERARELADLRYRNGLATQLEVTDARVQERTAEIHEIEAIKDYRLALLELERALGRKVPTVPRPLDQVTASLEELER